ncbi:MAG: ATP-binding cassette domain-containing protein [Burkholderiales bacterium]|nr:ATP-binding cassette domain-containing protein [Burkholderiales bacterium]
MASAPAPGASPGAALLEVADLSFTWPGQQRPAVEVASFSLAGGETVFLHGESGSGKSTLLSLLAGVLLPTRGRVALMGADWRALGRAARDRHRVDHVGYIFQQFNLLPYLGVLDNVLLPCRFSARRRAAAEADAGSAPEAGRALLHAMGLDEALWDRAAGRLSVGQQQRVAAARALIGSPALVIADEPTSALDEDRRDAFVDLLLSACERRGSALVFVSHDRRLAPRFARQVALAGLRDGAKA